MIPPRPRGRRPRRLDRPRPASLWSKARPLLEGLACLAVLVGLLYWFAPGLLTVLVVLAIVALLAGALDG